MPHAPVSRLPVILVLATGGTIAGRSLCADSPLTYQAGAIDVNESLQAVPGLSATARIRAESIAAIGSEHMTEAIWLRLREAINRAMAEHDIDGIVILHGTDTMEETAFFLELATAGDKPIVLTGAMRPADAVGADGPANLLAAVRTAADPAARGRGVLLVMNDVIHGARAVTKIDATNVAAFVSVGGGPLGRMVDGRPFFFHGPSGERRRLEPAFRLDGLSALPRVEIVYGHAGMGDAMAEAAARTAAGIVHAGVGMGHVHNAVRPVYAAAIASGVVVVRASRPLHGYAPLLDNEDARAGFVAAGDLNPQKARALLQLALTGTASARDIQDYFIRYGNALPRARNAEQLPAS